MPSPDARQVTLASLARRVRRALTTLAAAGLAASAFAGAAPPRAFPEVEGAWLPRGASPAAPTRATERWCGAGASATDRVPDAVAGSQTHVIYAIPADAPDASAVRAPLIVTDLAIVDRWWRAQDVTRTPRFDLHAFPGCDSQLGLLDLSVVRLARAGAAYAASPETSIAVLSADLAREPSFDRPHKKYLVYYDGPPVDRSLCGIAFGNAEGSGRTGYAIVYLQSGCGRDVGGGGLAAATAVHELAHSLGAVPRSAPNTCQSSPGHVCDTPTDLMYPFVNRLSDAVLDAGRDDYYGHAGAWFDVQDSRWLSRLDAPQFPLAVSLAGSTGTGRVVSDLPGIDCPAACAIGWDARTQVRLQATPAPRTRFAGWGGACAGTATECTVTMDAARSVTVRFAAQVALRVTVAGAAGVVVFGTERCSRTCSFDVDRDTATTLRATPSRGSRFVRWSGGCSGSGACTITPRGDVAVTATFARAAVRVAASVTGRGTVVSTPAGLSCRSRCARSFPFGQQVRLRAVPDRGFRFAGWSGACRGRAACTLRADRDASVAARFVRLS